HRPACLSSIELRRFPAAAPVLPPAAANAWRLRVDRLSFRELRGPSLENPGHRGRQPNDHRQYWLRECVTVKAIVHERRSMSPGRGCRKYRLIVLLEAH